MRLDRSFARLLLVAALLAFPQSALAAAIIVGDGTPGSCTDAALQSALAFAGSSGGGTVSFNCGPAPVTIVLTATLTVPNNTTVDGGKIATLSGPVVGDLLFVDHDSTAALVGLTITNTALVEESGVLFPKGNGLSNEGTLTVTNSTFTDSSSTAIGNGGTLTVNNSTIADNGHFEPLFIFCGGIANLGTVTINNSIVSGNTAFAGGGLCNIGGVATVNNSNFVENLGDQGGGGIVAFGGIVTVTNSTFSDNTTALLNSGAGGIFFEFAGTLTVTNSTFFNNGAIGGAGGISADGVIILKNSVFSANRGGGGAGAAVSGQVTISNSVFSDNSARGGLGGGLTASGTVSISNSRITNNTAQLGGGIFNLGRLTVRNSSITQNVAGNGGGIYNDPLTEATTTLKNTSVTSNTPNDIAP